MLIHRYWTGDSFPLHEPWLQRVIMSLNHGVELHEWTDNDLPMDYHKFFNDSQVRGQDAYRHKSNLVRLLLLYDFGGAWFDYDVIPLIPLNTLPCPSVASHNGLCNSFMYFQPHDSRLESALNAILEQPASSRPSTVVSGSVFLRTFLPDVHYLEYPFSPTGTLLHSARPFAIHLGGSSC